MIVQGDEPIEIDIDSLLSAWEIEMGDLIREAIEAGWQVGEEVVGGDSVVIPVVDSSLVSSPGFLRSGAILPVSARMASLDTMMVGLCRLQVDYVLPPYNLWRVRVGIVGIGTESGFGSPAFGRVCGQGAAPGLCYTAGPGDLSLFGADHVLHSA